jgi:hypothetical protein
MDELVFLVRAFESHRHGRDDRPDFSFTVTPYLFGGCVLAQAVDSHDIFIRDIS